MRLSAGATEFIALEPDTGWRRPLPLGVHAWRGSRALAKGRELWRSNGKSRETTLVKDIDPVGSSKPRELTTTNGRPFFSAIHPTKGDELFVHAP